MRGTRAKALREEARIKSLDGSVVKSYEYKRLKRLYVNPHYGQVKVLFPSKPGIKFTGAARLKRKQAEIEKLID